MLNFRYAPDRTPERGRGAPPLARPDATPDRAHGNSPPAPVAADAPLVQALRAAGDLDVEPKQAWTHVADFAARGLDAINFGPGATRFAHTPRRAGRDRRARAAATRALRATSLAGVASARAHLPRPARCATYPFVRLDEAAAARAARRARADRLRHGRPARADRPAIIQALRDGVRERMGYPARGRAAGAARGDRALGRAPLRRRRSIRTREIVPTLGSKEAIFSFAQVVLDAPAAATPSSCTEPGYPVYERGALFAGARVVAAAAPRGERLPARPRRRRRRDVATHRAPLAQLSEQPDRRRRAALVLRAARGARARARLRARLRRGLRGALLRRAAALGAPARRPHERRRVQHALEALVDDRLPLGVRRRRSGARSRRCGTSARTSGRRRRSSSSAPRSPPGGTKSTSSGARALRAQADAVPRRSRAQAAPRRGQRGDVVPLGRRPGGRDVGGIRRAPARAAACSSRRARSSARLARATSASRSSRPRRSAPAPRHPGGGRDRAPETIEASGRRRARPGPIEEAIAPLDRARCASPSRGAGEWVVNEWAKKAILLYFRLRKVEPMDVGRLRIPRQDPAQAGLRRRSACASCRPASRATARSSPRASC